MRKIEYISVLIILITIGISYRYYNILPDSIISHWDMKGSPNGYMNKMVVLSAIPIISIVIFTMFAVLSRIKDSNGKLKFIIKDAQNYLDFFTVLFLSFMLYVQIIIIVSNIGNKINIQLNLPVFIAIIFFYTGEILPKIKRNKLIGFRTPWTLKDDIVWEKTQLLGGKLFKIGGLFALISIFQIKYIFYITFLPITIFIIYIYYYSYKEYKLKIEQEEKWK